MNKAKEARERLGTTLTLSIQVYALTNAVKALLATHPDPQQVRLVFDQLAAQNQASPAYLQDLDQSLVMRDFAETVLFQAQKEGGL